MRELWHRVFHPSWWILGWHSEYKPDRPHVTWSLCLSDFNRPILRWELRDPDVHYVCLDWGNGNSDPAWSIGYEW